MARLSLRVPTSPEGAEREARTVIYAEDMNMALRIQLIKKIEAQEVPGVLYPLPVVTLEDFFVGNSDYGSIGCNLSNHPGPQVFFEVLRRVRDNPAVQDVLVEINDVVDDAHTWPFSDRVYILSSADIDDVRRWLEPIQPDEVIEGWREGGTPPPAPTLKPGSKLFAAWWD